MLIKRIPVDLKAVCTLTSQYDEINADAFLKKDLLP